MPIRIFTSKSFLSEGTLAKNVSWIRMENYQCKSIKNVLKSQIGLFG